MGGSVPRPGELRIRMNDEWTDPRHLDFLAHECQQIIRKRLVCLSGQTHHKSAAQLKSEPPKSPLCVKPGFKRNPMQRLIKYSVCRFMLQQKTICACLPHHPVFLQGAFANR